MTAAESAKGLFDWLQARRDSLDLTCFPDPACLVEISSVISQSRRDALLEAAKVVEGNAGHHCDACNFIDLGGFKHLNREIADKLRCMAKES